MVDILVTSPYRPFTLPNQFKAVFNGHIYCGTVDAVDPSVSQVQVYLSNEDGSRTPVAQPLRTNAGGYLVYNGQPAKFVTDSNHSLLVRDSLGNQVWYVPDMATFDPDSFMSELGMPGGASLVGTTNGTVQGDIDELGALIAKNEVVFASQYATPNTPSISQHEGLQQAWDIAAAEGKVFVVDGVFWVLPTNKTYSDGLVRPVALQVPNNSRAAWLPGSSINAIASALPLAYIINFYLAENFEIWNPTVYGDVDTHTGTADESYHCFNIVNCKNGYVHKPVAYDAWGDGLYIGTEYSGLTNKQLENVTIFEPYAKHCGRNCISITSGKNVNVVRPTVIDAFRTEPKAGVDIEPEGVGACLPVLDGVHVVGNITAEDCYYGLGIYTFDALQGAAKVTVGGVVAKNCFQPLQALNFAQNAGEITVGDIHVDTCDISPVGIKWSQYQLHLKIGDVYAYDACSGAPTTERYKSVISVDIDATSQPAANIGLFEVGDLYITNSGVNNVLCPFYFRDNTPAANRVLDVAKIGKVYGATVNKYFYADGVVSRNFEFEQVYETSFFMVNRRPALYSEVRISASGNDFELRMGSDYGTPLTIVKSDLTAAPIKVYPRAGGTFFPLSNGGAGYLLTTSPGSRVKLELNGSGPHFFESVITGTWTAP